MKVNNVDIRKYNAKQLTVDLQPPTIAINSEWVEGAAVPQEFETQVTFGTLKLTILFRGSGRSEVQRAMSEFLSLLVSKCELQLDGYKGIYIGYLTSSSLEKTKAAGKYIMTLQFNGYMTDSEVFNVYKGVSNIKFTTLGTRDTPCVIEVLPQVNLSRYVITGFGNDDIILTNLTKGKIIVIDGKTGTVTEDGINKFADCDMWQFPVLERKKENNISFSSSHCDVTIHYNPMWL